LAEVDRQRACSPLLGIAADPGLETCPIEGVSGIENFPLANVSVRIRGVEHRITAAIGGAYGAGAPRECPAVSPHARRASWHL